MDDRQTLGCSSATIVLKFTTNSGKLFTEHKWLHTDNLTLSLSPPLKHMSFPHICPPLFYSMGFIIRDFTHLSACSQRLDQSTGVTGRKQTQTPGPIVKREFLYKNTTFQVMLSNKTVYHTIFLYCMTDFKE
jgi:hypothetical protein